MLTVNDNFISFSIFEKFPELICVMSMRNAGDLYIKDLRQPANVQNFLSQFVINPDEFVSMEQVHGSEVTIVNEINKSGEVVHAVDGLVTQNSGLFLAVNTADCVPIFLYDPVRKIVGVVHAGWQGTEKGIVKKIIDLFMQLGSNAHAVFIAIGPHIGGCCYKVSVDFARTFATKFPNKQVAYKTQNKWHVDLGEANKLSLLALGVLPEHVDAPIACTSCQNGRYFSYRKDTKATFGEMLGVIGIRKKD